MRVCGVDEAGKGSVLGPMVIAGVMVEDVKDLGWLGTCDSKQLTSHRREELYVEITRRWRTSVMIQTQDEIDSRVGTMNALIASCHAAVIRFFDPGIAYVDACDVSATRFGSHVRDLSGIPELLVISEHKADEKFPIVGAASIVAKVTRDRLVNELSKEFGNIGSGYPSDPGTIRFLEEYIRNYGHPPACARRTWKTVSEIAARVFQQSLSDFF